MTATHPDSWRSGDRIPDAQAGQNAWYNLSVDVALIGTWLAAAKNKMEPLLTVMWPMLPSPSITRMMLAEETPLRM